MTLLFVAGAYAGSTFTRAKDRRLLLNSQSAFAAEDAYLQRLHDRYTADLEMTPEQIAKVQPAMEHARQQFRSIREDASKRTRSVMTDLYHAVQTHLTPEQQTRFAHLVKSRQKPLP
jgi:Spy/CpxP family protein refolding chaperone